MGTSFTFEANSTAIRTARTVTRYLPATGRILMGALFLFSGLLGLLVSPQPTPGLPEGAIAFSNALMKTGYMSQLISATEAIVGALLLANRFVPLSPALLAPIVVNILAFHVFLEPSGLPLAIVVTTLEVYLAWAYRRVYRPMLAPRAFR